MKCQSDEVITNYDMTKQCVGQERETTISSIFLMKQKILGLIASIFPAFRWGTTYSWEAVFSDLLAGTTLATVAIPQVF